MLDEGTKKAQIDIDAMVVDLRQNTKEHKDFMRGVDVMDRLTDISSLRVQVGELIVQQREVRGVMMGQQASWRRLEVNSKL